MRGTRWLPITLVLGLLAGAENLAKTPLRGRSWNWACFKTRTNRSRRNTLFAVGRTKLSPKQAGRWRSGLPRPRVKTGRSMRLGDRDWISAQTRHSLRSHLGSLCLNVRCFLEVGEAVSLDGDFSLGTRNRIDRLQQPLRAGF
jgi:hypothetical protein